jgi:putative oxidoreductase
MHYLPTIGRYLFAIPMLLFGMFHFMNASQMKGMVPSFIPGETFWVYLTGAALIAVAISIFTKKQVQLACNLLGIMLLIFVFTIHLPAVILEENSTAMMSFLKDMSLAGSAFVVGHFFREKK